MKLFKIMQTAFQNFDNTVNSYLSKVFNAAGVNNSHGQIFSMIFTAIKGVIQNAMFYIEDALGEQNIFTATRKTSIYSLAKMSGYEPFYGSCASGTLIGTVIRGSILDNDTTKIFIPNNAVVTNKESGINYLCKIPSNNYVIDISKPLLKHEFTIIEGNYRSNFFSASGNPFEVVHIESNYLFDRNYIKVFVNNVQFDIVESIYDMQEDAKQCVVSIGYDNIFDVMFGNGIYGKLLNNGDSIKIEWLSHNGTTGNILTNAKTKFIWQSRGRDTFGNTVDLNKFIKLQMNNCISGGINADTIDVVRNMIGYNSRSLVLATEENFKLFFKRFSFVGRINCWSEENSMYIIAACLSDAISNVISVDKYFNLNKQSLFITDDQKDQITNTLSLSNRTFAGVTLKFINPIIRRFAAICFIKIDDNYNKEVVKESIKQTLGNYFINLPDNTLEIYKSDLIYEVLNNCPEIKSFDLTLVSELAEETYEKSYYEKYELVLSNNTFNYLTKKVFYEKDNTPGMDNYGNIKLDSKLEIPLLQGGFRYYPNKETNDKSTHVMMETIQYYFI